MAITHEEFYKEANLKTNPFRTNPTSDADPRKGIWVGYEKERKNILKYLTRSRADQVGNINLIMIYGEYGTGKSHSLLWSQYYITIQEKEEFNSLVFYIPTLKKSKGLLSFSAAFNEDIINKSDLIYQIQVYKQFLDTIIVEYKRDKGYGPNVTDFLLQN